ncbi:helix-turn-helix transcriptional regulator [Nocardiopsis exhalans]|uniref:Helix-turn-helix transcriptional regulator n=1 Tax=Nocardiopsis exhalans TaxID=163604 RepID=A0ABY5DFC3_9ACTN|nr:helix-turn-helix transcriptional regulator [Nocardiopsis exhalans]USY21806.1 helix-turn-helix transcriptional regulator [Nocardiopsis exhalans]
MTREDPPPPYQTWEACRFDEQLNKACEAQGIDLQDVASRIGKSVQALRNVRYGISSPRASTIADIEAALHWVPGGYEQARQGKTPASAPREDPPAPEEAKPERLRYLFRTVHSPEGAPYTAREVAKGLRRAGLAISTEEVEGLSQVWPEASDGLDKALAEFFGVPTAYFTDAKVAQEVEKELALLAAMRDSGVKHLALRAAGLSARSLESIAQMVESARALEGMTDSIPQRDR